MMQPNKDGILPSTRLLKILAPNVMLDLFLARYDGRDFTSKEYRGDLDPAAAIRLCQVMGDDLYAQ